MSERHGCPICACADDDHVSVASGDANHIDCTKCDCTRYAHLSDRDNVFVNMNRRINRKSQSDAGAA